MAVAISPWLRLRISVSAIALFFLMLFFWLGTLILLNWSIWLLCSVVLGFAALSFLFSLIFKMLFKRFSLEKTPYFLLKATFVLTLFFTSFITFPFYYLAVKNDTDPLIMPQAVLSDGKKTVIFQGMVHVGSENFYKTVIYDLEQALADGYKIYYEGVTPSTPEVDKWFSDTFVSGGDLTSSYKLLADMCGVKFQLDYFKLLVIDMKEHPERHLTADVTTAEIKKEYERLLQQDPDFAQAVKDKQNEKKGSLFSDGMAEKISHFTDTATDSQKMLVGVICRSILSYSLRQGDTKKPNAEDPVLLDFRNAHLVQQILMETSDKVYITYGAGHLPGVIRLLQENDSAWQVMSLKWLRAMAPPEHLDGQLK